ncbi:MAG: pyridoxamine 5'-phosphate oxidase family protein [Deltaproteobacteria bacterium]|nr:pyridoxamine 5'-phosphate oxidase family protein [Deltaproteobacteria bacterium]
MKNPVSSLRKLWLSAHGKKDDTADYFLLASVDGRKRPHVRTVLIKTLGPGGIGFVTNRTGPKVWQFKHFKTVEGCIVWPKLTLQVRVAGKIKSMPKKTVQKLWKRRPREAQILYQLGLKQSSPIPSYNYLLEKVGALQKEWKKKRKIPLAPNYVGFVLVPTLIEFLHHNPTRLNKRELFEKKKGGWQKKILAP